MILTQKESELMKDLIGQEKLCVEKYNKCAQQAHDGQLKGLFAAIGKTEQQHLDTLNGMNGGQAPPQSGSSAQSSPKQFTDVYSCIQSPEKQDDMYLCTDTLATEKHASSLYDTSIFEFNDLNARNALNHIQKEEQEHGMAIYEYMKTNGMYS